MPLLKESEVKHVEEHLHLPIAKKFVAYNPYAIIGGSLGLYLHGIILPRFLRLETESDLDIILPFYSMEGGKELQVEKSKEDTYDNDFDEQVTISDIAEKMNCKLDIKIDPLTKYVNVTYKGEFYRVAILADILAAKCKYASKGNSKHIDDIETICGLRK